MSNLLSTLKKTGSSYTNVLSESRFFTERDMISTPLPILNIAFSGSLTGGMLPGVTMIAGESKSFKTLLSLYCIKTYLDKHDDAICIMYDSEFGSPPSYFRKFGIDPNRVLHVPVEHLEMLRSDMAQKLEKIKLGDHVFFLIDSLGGLASFKEADDAEKGKEKKDMTRPQVVRSLFRIITPVLNIKELPCVFINHVYDAIGNPYAGPQTGGGKAPTFASDQVFIITKAQAKEGTETVGSRFTINISKSRFVKEKSKLPFTVHNKLDLLKWSGLFDIAVEGGFIKNTKQGWYNVGGEKDVRKSEIEHSDDFWNDMVQNDEFKKYVEKTYKLDNVI